MSKRWFEKISAVAIVCVGVAVGSNAAWAAPPAKKPSRIGVKKAVAKLVSGLQRPFRKAGRAVRPVSWQEVSDTESGTTSSHCPHCPSGPLGRARCWLTHRCGSDLRTSLSGWPMRARYRQQSQRLQQQLAGKLAYFTPSGCGGAGCPPFGNYHVVYAVQPDYFDPRDGQVFAAPGTGVPMAVPLAPNVHYSYNYSHGIPSSRITPISDVIPPRRVD
ncbi:MAG: hypothetical protein GXP27_18115 [Planctomycetes bacterium]|nr:hypothetical protein [Planctomycetota bacterium]